LHFGNRGAARGGVGRAAGTRGQVAAGKKGVSGGRDEGISGGGGEGRCVGGGSRVGGEEGRGGR